MADRIQTICAHLSPCGTFADVGCDHGYCTQYMLTNGMCRSAIIADVSAKSIAKAERLLNDYIAYGVCKSVCCDGLEGIEEGSADLVLIAGMGGEEILKILKNAYIPRSFVFQPMKNAQKLRQYLLNSGCAITYDGIFSERRGAEQKYYFLMAGKSTGGSPSYSRAALAFGRDSLGTAQLKDFINRELEKNALYARGTLSPPSRETVERRTAFLKGVLNGEIE